MIGREDGHFFEVCRELNNNYFLEFGFLFYSSVLKNTVSFVCAKVILLYLFVVNLNSLKRALYLFGDKVFTRKLFLKLGKKDLHET